MEKKLVARLNEIGQEIGYPYQVLKNGQYQVFDENTNLSDVVMVVSGPIPLSSCLVEMKEMSENERKVWADLFPSRKEASDAFLTDDEEMKLIIFGRRRTVVNYFRKRLLSERIARAMVARNDDKLLIELSVIGSSLNCVLAEAMIKYSSDQRFEKFLKMAKQKGIDGFSEKVEKMLVKKGRKNKFSAYVNNFKLEQPAQYMLVQDKMNDFMKIFVMSGQRFLPDIENGLKFKSALKGVNETYQGFRKEYLAKQKG